MVAQIPHELILTVYLVFVLNIWFVHVLQQLRQCTYLAECSYIFNSLFTFSTLPQICSIGFKSRGEGGSGGCPSLLVFQQVPSVTDSSIFSFENVYLNGQFIQKIIASPLTSVGIIVANIAHTSTVHKSLY